jgi:glycosyltransferase involved in cell wall biosynthesis
MNLFSKKRGVVFAKPVKNRVLVVGQVPPPWGGQAVMIQKLLDAKLQGVELFFVPMSFSADMDEIGRFRWRKLVKLPHLVSRIWAARFRHGCNVLYYPPGGESLTAICRDIFVLICCRVLFRKIVFHVHAGGFTDVTAGAPRLIRWLATLAYRKPDISIQLTEKSPPDAQRIGARKIVFIPNGLADEGLNHLNNFRQTDDSEHINLLFVGVVSPSKGVRVLLEACVCLETMGVDFSLSIMGRFYSPAFEAECRSFIENHGLSSRIAFIGVKTGAEKWKEFCAADIFCFPSYFESENQSLVILEAMQFRLPCVASDWRGISTMVAEGETGYLFPVKDVAQMAERIEALAKNPVLRGQLGESAREVFLRNYTDEIWCAKMNAVLKEI